MFLWIFNLYWYLNPTFCVVLLKKLCAFKFPLVEEGRFRSVLTGFCGHGRDRETMLISVPGNHEKALKVSHDLMNINSVKATRATCKLNTSRDSATSAKKAFTCRILKVAAVFLFSSLCTQVLKQGLTEKQGKCLPWILFPFFVSIPKTYLYSFQPCPELPLNLLNLHLDVFPPQHTSFSPQ